MVNEWSNGNSFGASRSKIANYSTCKTSISSLLDKNVHSIHVSQMSGHKNIDSLKSYHSASTLQQESMYDIISKHQKNRKISTTKISISNSFQPVVSSNSMYSLKKKITKQWAVWFNVFWCNHCKFNFNVSSTKPKTLCVIFKTQTAMNKKIM